MNRCIAEDILKDFLLERGEDVQKIMMFDLTYEKQMENAKQEWFNDGVEEGRAEGRAEMQQNIVIKLLSANQFSDKAICSIVDISEEKLEEYKKMYMEQNEKK